MPKASTRGAASAARFVLISPNSRSSRIRRASQRCGQRPVASESLKRLTMTFPSTSHLVACASAPRGSLRRRCRGGPVPFRNLRCGSLLPPPSRRCAGSGHAPPRTEPASRSRSRTGRIAWKAGRSDQGSRTPAWRTAVPRVREWPPGSLELAVDLAVDLAMDVVGRQITMSPPISFSIAPSGIFPSTRSTSERRRVAAAARSASSPPT